MDGGHEPYTNFNSKETYFSTGENLKIARIPVRGIGNRFHRVSATRPTDGHQQSS